MFLKTTCAISAPVSITLEPIAPKPLTSPLTVAPILAPRLRFTIGLMGMGGLVKKVLMGSRPGIGAGLDGGLVVVPTVVVLVLVLGLEVLLLIVIGVDDVFEVVKLMIFGEVMI